MFYAGLSKPDEAFKTLHLPVHARTMIDFIIGKLDLVLYCVAIGVGALAGAVWIVQRVRRVKTGLEAFQRAISLLTRASGQCAQLSRGIDWALEDYQTERAICWRAVKYRAALLSELLMARKLPEDQRRRLPEWTAALENERRQREAVSKMERHKFEWEQSVSMLASLLREVAGFVDATNEHQSVFSWLPEQRRRLDAQLHHLFRIAQVSTYADLLSWPARLRMRAELVEAQQDTPEPLRPDIRMMREICEELAPDSDAPPLDRDLITLNRLYAAAVRAAERP